MDTQGAPARPLAGPAVLGWARNPAAALEAAPVGTPDKVSEAALAAAMEPGVHRVLI